MKIEVLFPEFCNLYGDISNIDYLKKCVPDAEVIYTAIDNEPAFLTQNVNLIYLGPLTERKQEIVIEKLMPYKEKIQELINNNTPFLFTGNAIEVLGKYIENEDGTSIDGLGIFEVCAKRNMMHRFNCLYMGQYDNIEIIGFKSQFTMLYGDNSKNYFMNTQMGIGINDTTKLEGIKENNFFGTYVIGPLLILNPLFTERLLKTMGVEKPEIAFKQDVIAAYEERLRKYKELTKK